MRGSSSSLSNSMNTGQDQYKSSHEQQNFIQKAYELVNNPNNLQIIHWSRSGATFIIEDIQRFQRDILPLYFRHNRYQSFVRQLNMYDFHKIRNGDYYCDNKSEFKHEEFSRGNYTSILQIKRKGFQAKTKQKQSKNTKIKKANKTSHKKTLKRRKVLPQKHRPQKTIPEPIKMDEEENSFFIDLPKQREGQVAFGEGLRKEQIVQRILGDVLRVVGDGDADGLEKRNKIGFIIDLAQKIKEIWVQNLDKIVDVEDVKTMKSIYHKVKQHISITPTPHSHCHPHPPHTSSPPSTPTPACTPPVPCQSQQNFDLRFECLIEQQQAIIDSIFRTEIKSTLICITSETFLTNTNNRKIDTLIGM